MNVRRAGGLVFCAVCIMSVLRIAPAQPAGAAAQFARSAHATARRDLTLDQAWRLAVVTALRRWSGQAKVAEIASIASPSDTLRSGSDGRRRTWVVTLVARNRTGARYDVRIIDGVITSLAAEPSSTRLPGMAAIPRIDSSTAIHVARRARPELGTGSTRQPGFGFIAHMDDRGRPVVAVIGEYRGHPAQVDVDARSGKVIQSLIYSAGSMLLYSRDAGQTWLRSTGTSGPVSGIIAVPGAPGRGYAIDTGIDAIQLLGTDNGGRSWTVVRTLPPSTGYIAHGLTMVPLPLHHSSLAVATGTGLWLSTDHGHTWRHGTGPTIGSVQWLAPGWLRGHRALLVSVTPTSGAGGVYASTDLRRWTKVIPEAARLSLSSDERAAIGLSQIHPGVAYINRRGDTALRMRVPGSTIQLAGEFDPARIEIAVAMDRVSLSLDGGNQWRTTLSTQSTREPFADVAVPPDFPASRVVLLTGLLGDVFRSTDDGQTWRRLRSLRGVVGDELGELTFLDSPRLVVMTAGSTSGSWHRWS